MVVQGELTFTHQARTVCIIYIYTCLESLRAIWKGDMLLFTQAVAQVRGDWTVSRCLLCRGVAVQGELQIPNQAGILSIISS